jgi:hypothetical protein
MLFRWISGFKVHHFIKNSTTCRWTSALGLSIFGESRADNFSKEYTGISEPFSALVPLVKTMGCEIGLRPACSVDSSHSLIIRIRYHWLPAVTPQLTALEYRITSALSKLGITSRQELNLITSDWSSMAPMMSLMISRLYPGIIVIG